ncbi:ribosome biogenesis GTPase Der [Succinimonas sp.]|uniref:ribosome biogenesis GTPase Der n=1 Tax=Succinimonas sp. TaxID=1936151 RepID=UPI00386BD27A
MTKVVALVGRPNVGKSTLFNRLTKTRDALVADFPGLTRDRKYGRAMYQDHEYILIDTGGIDGSEEGIETHMAEQSLLAIDEADLVLFLVDAKNGLSAGDYMIADYVRKQDKKVTVVANKIDGMDPDVVVGEFYALGLSGEIYPIAAEHGRGVGVLLDEVVAPVLEDEAEKPRFEVGPFDDPEALEWEKGFDFLDNVPVDKEAGGFNWYEWKQRHKPGNQDAAGNEAGNTTGNDAKDAASDKNADETPDTVPFADLPVKFAIVGRPNVGKSTLTNRMLGEDRVVVYDEPGTTRDSIYIPLDRDRDHYIVIDTAGVRKRKKVNLAVEKFSVVKTLQAIEDCNVALLVIDANAGVTDQDLSLLSFIIQSGRALVIAVNKWDGLSQEVKEKIKTELNLRLGFVDFAEVHFISALHGTGVGNLFDSIKRAYASATTRVGTSKLNRILEMAVRQLEPPMSAGRRIKLKYAHAGGYNPPRIIIHGNKTRDLTDSYKRYLTNYFRESLKIVGTPVSLEFHEGDNPFENKKNKLTQSQIRAKRRLMKFVMSKKRKEARKKDKR